jgi:hypothetical protein
MNPRTIARLEIMAAARQAQILDDIRRQETALAQIDGQRNVLAAYCDRLLSSWQNGSTVDAAQAQRAGHFVAASKTASVQIELAAVQAARSRDAALQALAAHEAHRRGLAEALREATLALDRATEKTRETAMPFRARPPTHPIAR